MKGPYTVKLHPCHPDHPERDTSMSKEPCDVAYVVGRDAEDDFQVEVCAVFLHGSRGVAQRIADALTAQEAAPLKSGTERDFELRLLQAAHCPTCDNTGTTPAGDECERCYHRKRAVAHLETPHKPSGGEHA